MPPETGARLDWLAWGDDQAAPGKRHLTYADYVAECKAEGIKPTGIHRFRSLMTLRGLQLAAQDMDATRRKYDLDKEHP